MREDLRNYPTILADTVGVPQGATRTIDLKRGLWGRMTFCRDYSEFATGIQPRKIKQILIDRHLRDQIRLAFIYQPLPNSEHGQDLMGQSWEGWEADTLDRILRRVQE